MHLLLVGMDHRSAPLAVRERCTWPPSETAAALAAFRGGDVTEAALLCTCNRTELYAAALDPAAAAARAAAVFGARSGLEPSAVRPLLYTVVGAGDTLRHLARVACGLDSLVLGETQVLGQVKEAYQRSAEAGMVGQLLHGLFHQVLFCAKRVHSETALAAAPGSVGGAAVELARRTLGGLEGRHAVLLGAGETAEIVARRLHEAGFARIDVVNRTPERAEGLAGTVGGAGHGAGDLPALLHAADVLITSTAAPGPVVLPEHVAGRPPDRPLLIVDIAVPRDVHPDVGRMAGIRLRNIDDLQDVAAAGRAARSGEAAAAEAIVDAEVRRFDAWLDGLAVAPVLAALAERMEGMAREQAERALRRMPDLAERERDLVRQLALGVVHKVLDTPLRRARDLAMVPGGSDRVRALSDLFGLDLPAAVGLPGGERGA